MALLPYETRCPLTQMRLVLVSGLPEFGVGLTPLVLRGPHCLRIALAVVETLVASACPLAPASAPGRNMANEASAATASRPAGRRI